MPRTRHPSVDIANARLRSQHLAAPHASGAEDIVRHFGAMQSQEFAVARWSIAQRLHQATGDTIDRAFAEGRILRTHTLRPTWHFVSPLDIRWIMAATAPRVQAFNAPYYRQTDLSPASLARANRVLAKSLKGGAHLTRAELAGRLAKDGIKAEGLRLACIMMNAELEQVVCSGAVRGKQHTYALFDERVPPARPMSREKAMAQLARRFFESHGPATVRDFRWWSSLTAGEARSAIEAAGSELERRETEGRTYVHAPGSDVTAKLRNSTVHLLQAYDEYVVAFTESKDVCHHEGHAGPRRSDGVQFIHAILIGTQIVGHWRRAESAGKPAVEFYVNRRLSKAEEGALRKAIDRYRVFMKPTEIDS